ncbi:MAG: restriction endonuclease [Kiritimatiellae bacterium]|nr:restriction endonuclease [Kiritimatiellia bacterium]
MQDTWRIYQRRLERLKETDHGTTETRNQWIVPFLGTLGYKLEYQQRGEVVDGRTYTVSHRDRSRGDFPVHIMGYRDSLDRKREDGGPRMSPHALVQEYLNLTEHLYAIATNGRQLRLLRDSTRLVKLSYIEFDLEQMIEEGHFADFAILFRILHATRMPVAAEHAAESLIEQYHQDALDSGSRIRDGLSKAVERSIIAFGNGFLRHPDNEALRDTIRDNQLDARTYYQYQLRLIYRLLFLMVIEERNLVYPDGSDRTKRDIYNQYYSVSNLRRLAGKRHLADTRHTDYWISLRNTFRIFEHEKYGTPLGIKPLSGDLFSYDAIRHLNICTLDNSVLISCLSNLSVFEHPDTQQRIRVNYAALNVEEFGSVYEGLLEYDAQVTQSNNKFVFKLVKGDERAASGSHYTPDELVTPLIRNSLDHVINRKIEEAKKNAKKIKNANIKAELEKALLSITVCDVACGSGHILLSAARRIATELAVARTGEDQPSPKAQREAVRDVIRHCIYGVDLNPMAVELCKVALWLESHNPNAPLGFLDHHIKCGNAIVGLAKVDELERGIPDEAFKTLADDDKGVCALLRRNNKVQRKDREAGQQINYGEQVGLDLRKVLAALVQVDAMPERTPEEVEAKQAAYDKWKTSTDRRNLRIVADLQVAQFFISKTPETEAYLITDETYFRYLKGELQLTGPAVAKAMAVANQPGNKFFHWFLEFPEVFSAGGFDCILGNPPYLGGQALSGTYGYEFCEWVRYQYAPTGLNDLVVFFLRRNYELIASGRFVSILTTNSIKDGDVRKDGLEVILEQGGSINFAVGAIKWPGRANLYVSLLSIYRGAWSAACNLNNHSVDYISAFLEDYKELGDPLPLAVNAERMFQGSIFLGDGFLLNDAEADKMIYMDTRNSDVIFPTMNGQELNNDPHQLPGRKIINFFDWTEQCAADYSAPYLRLRELVYPVRQKQNRASNRERWWIYAEHRPGLCKALKDFSRCFCAAATTKYLNFSLCPTNWVFSHAIYVFCSESFAEYAVLQSTLHDAWARKYSGCLETRLRYSPSDCFRNYPFPATLEIEHLALIGERYHEERKQLMLQLQLGLTKTYNLFHTRDLTLDAVAKTSKVVDLDAKAAHAAIRALRQRHIEMDNAVLKAYGWDQEVDLAHDFYEVDYLPENDNLRFTISPDTRREILQRLLKLNHERYAEEIAAGLHDKKGKQLYREKIAKPHVVKENAQGLKQKELGL